MRPTGSKRLAPFRYSPPAVLALLATACSSGMPDMPAMPSMPTLPSFAALASETPAPSETETSGAKPRGEQKSLDIAEILYPGVLGDKSIGKPNAPVTIVEYASLTCPNCARFHEETLPKIRKAYIDTGKVRLIFREFPIGRASAAAALAVRCAPDKDYFKLVDKFLATQKDWVAQEIKKDEIFKIVQTSGIKRDKFDACLTNAAVNDPLVLVKQRGRGFGVAGTPTFFVNGRKVAGAVSFEQVQPVIDAAIASPQAAPPSPQVEQPVAKPQVQASVNSF